MAPVTVPAASPPMSWHIAQLGLKHNSAQKNAKAMSTAARRGEGESVAETIKTALNGSARTAIERPAFSPYRLVNSSVSHPPAIEAIAPVNSTALASQADCCG